MLGSAGLSIRAGGSPDGWRHLGLGRASHPSNRLEGRGRLDTKGPWDGLQKPPGTYRGGPFPVSNR